MAKFITMEQFEQMAVSNPKGSSGGRRGSGKANEIREFLKNPENIGKPCLVPSHWLKCAKVEAGYTKDTTDEQLGQIRHAFNAAIESLNRNDFGGKLQKKIVYNNETREAYILVTHTDKYEGHETARTTPENPAPSAEKSAEEQTDQTTQPTEAVKEEVVVGS